MTRILLAMLGFYRRWISPALHAMGGRRLSFCADLLGVRNHRHRDARPYSGQRPGDLAAVAMPPLLPWRARSRTVASNQTARTRLICRTSHYHRKSGVPTTPKSKDCSFGTTGRRATS